MSALLDKIKKNSTIKESAVLAKSKFFLKKDMISTPIPIINVALSGQLDGGLTPGLTVWAGSSKNFKTGFSLLMAKAYLDKYEDAVLLFYDSEFGTPQSYFSGFGIDIERVLHSPITDVEQLKFDVMQQMNNIERGDHIIIVIDSIGNLASKKEVDDALDGKSVADLSRAKQLKSLFRMVTPHLMLKDIPMVVVNHTYKTMELYSKDIMSGGTGGYYSADNIFILGRQQEKDGTELTGWNFIINVEKSRYVKEKSKFAINVSFNNGISKWSGLMDIALEGGFVVKPKNGWFAKVNMDTGEIDPKNWRLASTNCTEFWESIITTQRFQDYVKQKYQIANGSIVQEDSIDTELDKIDTSLADFDDLAEGD